MKTTDQTTPRALPRVERANAGAGTDDERARSRVNEESTELGPAVSTITGDRVCVQCGFNLMGQIVRKEPRFGLFIARCPECGRAAALEEHPRMAQATARLMSLLAGLWLTGLTLLLVLGGVAAGSALFLAIDQAGSAFGEAIMQAYAASPEGAERAASIGRVGAPFWTFDPDWWNAQNKSAVFASWGGMREGLWRARLALGPAGLIAFLGGMFLAVLALHARWRRLLWIALMPLAVATVMLAVRWFVALDRASTNITPVDFGVVFVHWKLGLAGLVWLYAAIGLGALAGRPAARLLAQALLPPRLCSSLSILWTTDGKLPPRTACPQQRTG